MLLQKRNSDKEKCYKNESEHPVLTVTDDIDSIPKRIYEKKAKEINVQSQVIYEEELNTKIFLSAYWQILFDAAKTKLPISAIIK